MPFQKAGHVLDINKALSRTVEQHTLQARTDQMLEWPPLDSSDLMTAKPDMDLLNRRCRPK